MKRLLLFSGLLGLLVLLGMSAIVGLAARSYGPPADGLTIPQVIQYSAKVLWADGLLTKPRTSGAPEQDFEVQPGESVISVCQRLEQEGLIVDGRMLRDYLVYSGKDTGLQAGRYRLSAGLSMIDIAAHLQDATPAEVEFVILPGWRIEEIAAALPTSGLEITADQFIAAAAAPHAGAAFLVGATTSEGFLFPGAYVLPRSIPVEKMLEELIRNFELHLSIGLQEGFARQDLTVYQAVTLASIIQREAVHPEEGPLIASVYLNRLRDGGRLDADPTVQYALGFNATQQTWWTNPLSLTDLAVESPYNTYQISGLPPSPISNPALAALEAVAAPADTPYRYFSSRCDQSGYHNFAVTFEEHRANLCP